MNEIQCFDDPIEEPKQDLFEMTDHAETLAERLRHVTQPFTVGVYGEWGAGKTSFVRLVEYYLEKLGIPDGKQVCFVSFTAAPYATSETVWQGLILTIARKIYCVPADYDPDKAASTQKKRSKDFFERLPEILGSTAIPLREEPKRPEPYPEYSELLTRLRNTSSGGVSKNPERQSQIEEREALMAVFQASMTVLESISPLAAIGRTLFSSKSQAGLMNLFREEKNKITHNTINSVQDYRKLFLQIFEKSQDRRVFVFIDDLDRCSPDVALDILEAIKTLTEGAPCIFLVAANKELIEQGLNLRYKGLAAGNDPQSEHELFSRMGKEYFEKYVQLGIPVPTASPELVHKFISAQFPEWVPATDIIEVAIGANPRRLKQQCSLLSYKYAVALKQGFPRSANWGASHE